MRARGLRLAAATRASKGWMKKRASGDDDSPSAMPSAMPSARSSVEKSEKASPKAPMPRESGPGRSGSGERHSSHGHGLSLGQVELSLHSLGSWASSKAHSMAGSSLSSHSLSPKTSPISPKDRKHDAEADGALGHGADAV